MTLQTFCLNLKILWSVLTRKVQGPGYRDVKFGKLSCGFDSKQIAVFYWSILTLQIKHMSARRATKQIEAILVGNQMETCLPNGVKL